MSPSHDARALDAQELLAQVGWVRALARRVAGDTHAADDLAQQALLVALSSDERRPRSLRGWLTAVIGNLDRSAFRAESRRARREELAARAEASPSTLELVERASVQRALVGALLELDEPYRATLLLRFFEGCTPREIAERAEVPESTVASRTAEGLKRLRSRLTRGGEGPSAWLPSIVPLLRWPRRAALQGAVVLSTQTKLILSGLAIVAALVASRALLAPDPAGPGDERLAGPEPELSAPVPRQEHELAAPTGPDSARVQPAVVAAPASDAEVTVSGLEVVRGKVIDLAGLPVSGVDVCRVGKSPPSDAAHAGLLRARQDCVVSDAQGAFELEALPPLRLRVRSERYTTVYEGVVMPTKGPREPVVVVSWRLPLGGLVVDATGEGVPGAVVTVVAPQRQIEVAGNVLSASSPVVPETRSDEVGLFSFSNAAELEDARLHVAAAGFLAEHVPVPEGGDTNLRIVLRRADASGSALTGRVELPDGSPAAGALVSTGWITSEADAEGRFVLELAEEPPEVAPERSTPRELVAVSEGYLPARRALPSTEVAEVEGWPRDVVLRLEGTPLRISGRVVDEEGNPVRRVVVQALDVTRFGIVRGSQPGWFHLRTVEETLGGGEVRTNAEGEFELAGLLERDYRLEALWRPSLLTTVTEPVAAGSTDVTIVLDRGALGRIAGRIIDGAGVGIEGVQISVSADRTSYLEIGSRTTTDAEGRFALEGVTTRPPYLRLEGDPIVPELFREIPAGADVGGLELRVGRRCHLQVDWSGWSGRADEMRIVDASGEPVALMILEGNRFTPLEAIAANDGLSAVVAVPDQAAHGVLMLGDEEVERIPLRPVPGELELLRP